MSDVSSKEEHSTSVFHHVVKSDMPESDKSEERLMGEAQVMLGGGTVTTARTLTFASYYILSRPEVRGRLESEVKDFMAEWPERVPTWAELERLPFLQGIIKESLRYAFPASVFVPLHPSILRVNYLKTPLIGLITHSLTM